MTKEIISSYKGFNKDLKCRDFQYEVGNSYEQFGKIECCENGFHACTFPTDVFNYYPPINGARYCTVIQSGDLDSNTMIGDSKIASSKIYIESEISTEQLIEAGVNNILKDASKYIKDATYRNCCSESGNSTIINNNYAGAAINMGSYSAAINNKANSVIASTNEHSVVVNKGSESIAGTTENNSIIYNTKEGDSSICSSIGNNSIIRSTADESITASTGWYSYIINNGFRSAAVGSGTNACVKTTNTYSTAVSTNYHSHTEAEDFSVAISTGKYSTARVTKGNSIAIVTNEYSWAAGALNDWIVLTEYTMCGLIKEVKAFKVDGEKIKADTFYKLKDGEAVEVDLKF